MQKTKYFTSIYHSILFFCSAEISGLSSKNLDKYELLTGEDVDLTPSTVAHAKFEYPPLDKILNKGLSEEDKKEGLLKKPRNIEGKNDEQLKAIEDQEKNNYNNLKILIRAKR